MWTHSLIIQSCLCTNSEIILFEIVLQVKLSIYLAMGRMGVCVGSPKVGPTTCFCSRGFGKGSPSFILGQNQAGIWLLVENTNLLQIVFELILSLKFLK